MNPEISRSVLSQTCSSSCGRMVLLRRIVLMRTIVILFALGLSAAFFCLPVAAQDVAIKDEEIDRKPTRSSFEMREFRNFISMDLSRPYSTGSMKIWGIQSRKVYGQVVDRDGNAVKGALVAIAEPIGYSGRCYDENFDKTDELGRFVVEAHIRKNRLVIRRGKGQIWRANVNFDQDFVKVTWPKPSKLKIQVDSDLCKPESELFIRTTKYWAGMSAMSYRTKLDKEHQASVDEILPGDYTISYTKTIKVNGAVKNRQIEIGKFTIGDGQVKTFRCRLTKGARITGKLAKNAYVVVERQKNSYHDVHSSVALEALNDEGNFQIGLLPPGRYLFRFYAHSELTPRRGFGFGTGGDRLLLRKRVTVNQNDTKVELDLKKKQMGTVAFVQAALDSEPSRRASWSHSDVQAARLKRHKDRDAVVRELLRILNDPHAPHSWTHVVLKALEGMTESPKVVDELIAALELPHRAWSTPAIIRTLQNSKSSNKEIVDRIAKFRKNENLILRSVTFNAFVRLATSNAELQPQLIPYLIEGLSEVDDTTRSSCANALGRLNAKSAVKALYRTRDDPSGNVSVWSAWAIWKITGAREQAVEVFTNRLRSKTFNGKSNAINLLSEFKNPSKETIAILVELSKFQSGTPYTAEKLERNMLQSQAIKTLKKIAPKALGN